MKLGNALGPNAIIVSEQIYLAKLYGESNYVILRRSRHYSKRESVMMHTKFRVDGSSESIEIDNIVELREILD